MSADSLSPEYIRQVLSYQDGKLFWLPRPLSHFKNKQAFNAWNTKYAGKEAGSISANNDGVRWGIRINRTRYYRAILVYTYHHGWPNGEVDHRNRDRLDDSIENLRLATRSKNAANTKRKRTNTSGFKGVNWHSGAGKWMAQIRVHPYRLYLGLFPTPEEAHAAYCAAAKHHFGEFAHTD